MIVIFSGHDDIHALCVQRELERQGHRAAIIDTAQFGRDLLICRAQTSEWRVKIPSQKISLTFDEVETIWLRRPGRIDLAELVSTEYLEFAVREWRDVMWGWLDGTKAQFVNPLVAQERSTKPLQLEAAQNVGLRIPATCITNDKDEFLDFVTQHHGNVVHKSLTQTSLMLLDTIEWEPRDSEFLPDLRIAPTILQERIHGPEDIRLTVIGEDVFAAKVTTPNDIVDSRLVKDLPYEACSIPDDISKKILSLMERLGLVFATIDLKATHDGDIVFLEVNPQGQFIYIEIITGLPLIASFSQLLMGR